MATRVLLALVIVLHSAFGWGSILRASDAPVGPSSVLVHPCGTVCCCGPHHCPCVIEVPLPASSTPVPAVPPQRGDHDGPRLAPEKPDTASPLLVAPDAVARHGWSSLSTRPLGDMDRRVMQLQCVWRT